MLATGFLGIIYGLVSALVLVLPAIHLPQKMISAGTYFMSYIYYINVYFPITQMFIVLGILIAFESVWGLWKLSKFIINIVRGSGV